MDLQFSGLAVHKVFIRCLYDDVINLSYEGNRSIPKSKTSLSSQILLFLSLSIDDKGN